MMRCDAEWLGRTLAGVPVDQLSPLLNLGASTRHFREVEQPYIADLVFRPLAARGVRVVHSDLKAAEGVDVVGDVFDDADFARLKAIAPRAVICTHMFEHVRDRAELSRRLLALLPEDGLFFVTVPSSYHEHHDPIDTMYRPTPDELAALFAGHQILHKSELVGDTYWNRVAQRPVTLFLRHFFRFFVPFLGWRAWKRSMGKLYWLFHHYKVAAVVGRKQPV
ncbi:MAG TPA: methyltransferase domain-containing protein [Hyphomicrobiaceae bacterium]|nr:methyltransferase domain-containing protein [Hyphomicrobiaceae bacterium]